MNSSSLQPTFTSSTGGADNDTRIVSPIPSASNTPNVGFDHGNHIMVFYGDLEVMEADVLEHVGFFHGGGDERFRGRTAVFGVQFLV